MDFKQVLKNAEHLNPDERALVAHCLISSLETSQDEDVDQAWVTLVVGWASPSKYLSI